MSTLQTNAQASAVEHQVHFTAPRSHRFLFLDALRGIAALFVVAFHFPTSMASSLAPNGTLAVDFFFCLSGFVIAFSYENRLSGALSFKDFAVARWIRLYPIYAIGSLLGILFGIAIPLVVYHGVDWSHWFPLATLAFLLWPTRLSSLSYIDNFPLNPAAWSLFFEIFANLVYALLMKLRKAQTAVLLLITAISLVVLLKAVIGGQPWAGGPKQSDFGLGFARVAFSFFVGVLLCRLYRSRPRNTGTERTQWLLPLIITVSLIAILNSPFSYMRTEAFRFAAITVCCPALVYFGALVRLPHKFARLSAALGELSYPLYLLHQPLIRLMNARHLLQFAAGHPVLINYVSVSLIAVIALFAWWVGDHVDLPIRRALTRRYNLYKTKQEC